MSVESPETKKRRRERRIALFLMLVFLITTSLQVFFTDRAQEFGFEQSLLYFALLYLNVILIMFLVFLVSRNLIRAYLARKSGTLGGGLRWRLVSSLLAFSMLPSIVLFVASSAVIRQGFDRWFGGQVSSALEDSQTITEVHYKGIEENLEFFADRVAKVLQEQQSWPNKKGLEQILQQYPIEAAEIYTSILEAPQKKLGEGIPEWKIPRASSESLEKAFEGTAFHLIRKFGEGDLLQFFLPITLEADPKDPRMLGFRTQDTRILVLSYTVPLGLKTRIAKLKQSFVGYQQTRLLKDSLKTNYTLILLTFFVFIVFVVSWFGLYIARSIIEPVSELLKGTEAFREGRWDYRIATSLDQKKSDGPSAGADLEVLKSAFNLMAEEVGQKSRQIEEANAQLVSLVRDLEERERYLENILSSIRRGVAVVSPDFNVQRVNVEALAFSTNKSPEGVWTPEEAVGRRWSEIFPNLATQDEVKQWLGNAEALRGQPVEQIFELRKGLGRASALQSIRATAIWVLDEYEQALGWLVILEDVSDAARVERLAAWQEVARRVAHEIKNPLTPIQISADRLKRKMMTTLDEDDDLLQVSNECLGQVTKQVRVIRDLVREFSEFAKLPEPKFERVNIGEVLEALLGDYRFTHPDCKFSLEIDGSIQNLSVRADTEYLRRVFVNLADNSLQSMEGAKVQQPEFRVSVIPMVAEPTWLRIVFEDNGPGIPESMREKIFDPYVTSKASGLGLGLAIVRRIAVEHLGRVRCEAGEGARFVLELPTLGGENLSP